MGVLRSTTDVDVSQVKVQGTRNHSWELFGKIF
jgi:hypothetical protein